MQTFSCSSCDFRIINDSKRSLTPYPYLRDTNGDKVMFSVSPLHGRSFLVGKIKNGRYVISKGNGLSYSSNTFLHTGEFYDGTWGLLLLQDAKRDFIMGQEVESIGIKTNHMHYILELDFNITLPSGNNVKPILLQYDVETPYRICDAPFMSKEQIQAEVGKWERINVHKFEKYHIIAADVLIRNLRILHDNNILHNAIHEQNYTWALELLDFELSCSPQFPYTNEDDQRHSKDLFPREIMQTYTIINYIAGVLKENVDYVEIDNLFKEYGFEIKLFDIMT